MTDPGARRRAIQEHLAGQRAKAPGCQAAECLGIECMTECSSSHRLGVFAGQADRDAAGKLTLGADIWEDRVSPAANATRTGFRLGWDAAVARQEQLARLARTAAGRVAQLVAFESAAETVVEQLVQTVGNTVAGLITGAYELGKRHSDDGQEQP